MVDIVVVGAIGLDVIETPFGKVSNVLGGSATYAAYSASFFSKPGLISVVGDDFPEKHERLLEKRNICLKGIKKEGKTFRWEGYYEFDMSEAKTLRTELNAFETFRPEVPDDYKKSKYIFLANMDPELQSDVMKQMENPKLIVMDTMNFWIDHKKEELISAIKKVDILLLNDGEARQLFETTNLVRAAKEALKLGPKYVIIKKGEHGALLFSDSVHFSAPGYPLENVKDPTGCGDSFGGALTGYLAKTDDISERNIRRAIVYGSVVASYNAEGFSLENMKGLTDDDIEKRFSYLRDARDF